MFFLKPTVVHLVISLSSSTNANKYKLYYYLNILNYLGSDRGLEMLTAVNFFGRLTFLNFDFNL